MKTDFKKVLVLCSLSTICFVALAADKHKLDCNYHDGSWSGGATYNSYDACIEAKRLHDNRFHNKADVAFCSKVW